MYFCSSSLEVRWGAPPTLNLTPSSSAPNNQLFPRMFSFLLQNDCARMRNTGNMFGLLPNWHIFGPPCVICAPKIWKPNLKHGSLHAITFFVVGKSRLQGNFGNLLTFLLHFPNNFFKTFYRTTLNNHWEHHTNSVCVLISQWLSVLKPLWKTISSSY